MKNGQFVLKKNKKKKNISIVPFAQALQEEYMQLSKETRLSQERRQKTCQAGEGGVLTLDWMFLHRGV